MKIIKFKDKEKYKYNRKVSVKNLILKISIGLHDFEKKKKQRVRFNIDIITDSNIKPDNSNLLSIVNYEDTINKITSLTKTKHHELLEDLAENIFDIIFKSKIVKKVNLKLEKLDIIKNTESVGIEVSKKEMNNSLELGKKIIKEKIPLIPKNPGIYRMISVSGEILYIGKAKNIPNRLKSYVTESNLPIRTERMLSLTHNLEVTTTNNESEALLLEANLIKKHKPRFNILLRDDKSFPYIYIGHKDKWPQLTKLRGKKSKSGYYFGPFASIGSANWTIKILQKIFQIRVCDDTVFKNRERPCILYQIKRCSAPCVGHIEEAQYKKTVSDAIDFISGKSRRIQKSLSKDMELASKELDFEKAAIARDRIKALTQIQTSQKINQTNLNEADVVSIYKESGKTCIQVFF